MVDATSFPNFTSEDLPDRVTADEAMANRFTQAALERHKQEGLWLAVRARWVALAVISMLFVYLNPNWDMLYYHGILALSAGVGWMQLRVGRVGQSRPELSVMFCDLLLMTVALAVPNPFSTNDWPTAMSFRFDNFSYMYVILALATLSYSWRTIMAVGVWTSIMWGIACVSVWWFGVYVPALSVATQEAFGHDPFMAILLDPNSFNFNIRFQNQVIFLIVAVTLSLSIRRFNRLVLGNATLERERSNLSRYFSPNMVEELSQNDDPLKQTRSHDVAIVFVDIKGFTRFAADRSPEAVIATLREFHGRMEAAVFAHGGTLDKFLGDGLMASFGTPIPSDDDTQRAYKCVRAMVSSAQVWNAGRKGKGEPELDISIGLHVGPVVLGDIGGNRLEFAVIGNTVNIASRIEGLTRVLDVSLVISDEIYQTLEATQVSDLTRHDAQHVAGLDAPITVWSLPACHGTD
ncbi:MAG: adenylate/guanylate cyclase domain-containing protein [Aliishimia sp.]